MHAQYMYQCVYSVRKPVVCKKVPVGVVWAKVLSLSTVVLSIGMGPMPAIVDLWGYNYDGQNVNVLLLLPIVRHP